MRPGLDGILAIEMTCPWHSSIGKSSRATGAHTIRAVFSFRETFSKIFTDARHI